MDNQYRKGYDPVNPVDIDAASEAFVEDLDNEHGNPQGNPAANPHGNAPVNPQGDFPEMQLDQPITRQQYYNVLRSAAILYKLRDNPLFRNDTDIDLKDSDGDYRLNAEALNLGQAGTERVLGSMFAPLGDRNINDIALLCVYLTQCFSHRVNQERPFGKRDRLRGLTDKNDVASRLLTSFMHSVYQARMCYVFFPENYPVLRFFRFDQIVSQHIKPQLAHITERWNKYVNEQAAISSSSGPVQWTVDLGLLADLTRRAIAYNNDVEQVMMSDNPLALLLKLTHLYRTEPGRQHENLWRQPRGHPNTRRRNIKNTPNPQRVYHKPYDPYGYFGRADPRLSPENDMDHAQVFSWTQRRDALFPIAPVYDFPRYLDDPARDDTVPEEFRAEVKGSRTITHPVEITSGKYGIP